MELQSKFPPPYKGYEFKPDINIGDLEEYGCKMAGSFESYLYHGEEMLGRPFVGDWLVQAGNGAVRLYRKDEYEKNFEPRTKDERDTHV